MECPCKKVADVERGYRGEVGISAGSTVVIIYTAENHHNVFKNASTMFTLIKKLKSKIEFLTRFKESNQPVFLH